MEDASGGLLRPRIKSGGGKKKKLSLRDKKIIYYEQCFIIPQLHSLAVKSSFIVLFVTSTNDFDFFHGLRASPLGHFSRDKPTNLRFVTIFKSWPQGRPCPKGRIFVFANCRHPPGSCRIYSSDNAVDSSIEWFYCIYLYKCTPSWIRQKRGHRTGKKEIWSVFSFLIFFLQSDFQNSSLLSRQLIDFYVLNLTIL